MKSPTDGELCEAFRRGDKQAGDAILRRHEGLIHSTIRRCLGRLQAADCDEYAQVGRMAMLAAARHFRSDISKFSTYAVIAIQNSVRREAGRRSKRVQEEYDIKPEIEESDARPELPNLDCLRPIERKVLECYYGMSGEPESYAKIANRIGRTPAAVQQLHHDAVKRLRQQRESGDAG